MTAMLKASFKRHDEYPLVWRYVIAVALVLIALVLSDAVWDIVHETPFQIFFAAVALSAWVGGMGPGLLAMALSIVLADYFLIPPLGVIFTVPSDIVQFIIFAAVA
ncbi:MAG: DUF4118 domain-containing protein, partial [Anaerolineae bacterium]|nr:DUF4118 domain-containing protein [Anaerolineae bacterium]